MSAPTATLNDDSGETFVTICVSHPMSSFHDRCACGVRLPLSATLTDVTNRLIEHPRFGPCTVSWYMYDCVRYNASVHKTTTLASMGVRDNSTLMFGFF